MLKLMIGAMAFMVPLTASSATVVSVLKKTGKAIVTLTPAELESVSRGDSVSVKLQGQSKPVTARIEALNKNRAILEVKNGLGNLNPSDRIIIASNVKSAARGTSTIKAYSRKSESISPFEDKIETNRTRSCPRTVAVATCS